MKSIKKVMTNAVAWIIAGLALGGVLAGCFYLAGLSFTVNGESLGWGIFYLLCSVAGLILICFSVFLEVVFAKFGK